MTPQMSLSLRGRMHAANPDKSARLLRVLGVLSDGEEHSTLNLMMCAQVCAVNSCISELRQAGHDIECKRRGDVWFYVLRRMAVAA